MKRLVLLFFSTLLIGGCSSIKQSVPSLSPAEITPLVPSQIPDREGWATEIASAIEAVALPVTVENACMVIAIIGQESGFELNPKVSGLPAIVREALRKKFSRLGPAAGPTVKALLKLKAPGTTETFEKRISKLKTERDLDYLFRDIEIAMRKRFPGPVILASLASKLMGQGWLEDLNPVTTIGSMQVKVSYAKTLRGMSDAETRDFLYTRKGGVEVGASRLLGYEAKYENVIFRFADYNSGVYSSRNAAFQGRLSQVMKRPLIPDGDLLNYRPDGKVRPEPSKTLKLILEFCRKNDISERAVLRDVKEEKTADFEETELWQKLQMTEYAIMPQVSLRSPKLSSTRSTRWFAENVMRRYEACLARNPKS